MSTESIIKKFPALAGHENMVEFILELRCEFNIEHLPFEIKAGNWKGGGLDEYFKSIENRKCLCETCEINRGVKISKKQKSKLLTELRRMLK